MGSGWHEFVQKGRGTEEEKRERAKVKVWIVLQRLLVSLVTILGKAVTVVVASSCLCHHAKECAVEGEVVATTQEKIVTCKGCVGFELVVPIKTRLTASQDWCYRGSVCCVTSNRKSLSDKITIGQGETEDGEKCGQIVPDIVQILLSVNELVEGGYTVVSKEVVVGSSIQSWTRATDIVGTWCNELMGGVSWSWDLVAAFTHTLGTVLGTVVWVFSGDPWCWDVIWVVWAS